MTDNNTNEEVLKSKSDFTSEIEDENVNKRVVDSDWDGPSPKPKPKVGGSADGGNEETGDINEIKITVSDQRTPVIILFGARNSGKTMTLIRLTRYLKANEYKVLPVETFREGDKYKKLCKEYSSICNRDLAADSTSIFNFMLLNVIDKFGHSVCQLLEAPGEHYFDPDHPDRDYLRYLHQITSLPNKRVWMIIVELGWGGGKQELRNNYKDRVIAIPSVDKNVAKDKFIFMCNKIDMHPELIPGGNINEKEVFEKILGEYPGIFAPFKNKIPILNWFKKYNFQFVPFSAGTFPPIETGANKGKRTYVQGSDEYPIMLWNAILKAIGKKM